MESNDDRGIEDSEIDACLSSSIELSSKQKSARIRTRCTALCHCADWPARSLFTQLPVLIGQFKHSPLYSAGVECPHPFAFTPLSSSKFASDNDNPSVVYTNRSDFSVQRSLLPLPQRQPKSFCVHRPPDINRASRRVASRRVLLNSKRSEAVV